MALIFEKFADYVPRKNQRWPVGLEGNLCVPAEQATRGMVLQVPADTCLLMARKGKIEELCAMPGNYRYESCSVGSVIGMTLAEESAKLLNQKDPMKEPYAAGEPRDVWYLNLAEVPLTMDSTEPMLLHFIDTKMCIDYDAKVTVSAEWSLKISDPVLFYVTFRDKLQSACGTEELRDAVQREFDRGMQKALIVAGATNVSPADLSSMYPVLASAFEDHAKSGLEPVGVSCGSVKVTAVTMQEQDLQVLNGLIAKQREVEDMQAQITAHCRRSVEKSETERAVQEALAMLETLPGWSPFRENAPAAPQPETAAEQSGDEKNPPAEDAEEPVKTEEPVAPAADTEMPELQENGLPRFPTLEDYRPAEESPAPGEQNPFAAEQVPVPEEINLPQTPQPCGLRAKPPEWAETHNPFRKKAEKKTQRWYCSCGTENALKFCTACGAPRPATPPAKWICACGTVNDRKFCRACGTAYTALWE